MTKFWPNGISAKVSCENFKYTVLKKEIQNTDIFRMPYLHCLSSSWNVDVMAGELAATVVHALTLKLTNLFQNTRKETEKKPGYLIIFHRHHTNSALSWPPFIWECNTGSLVGAWNHGQRQTLYRLCFLSCTYVYFWYTLAYQNCQHHYFCTLGPLLSKIRVT